jgi:hypothetical protein
MKPEIRSTVVLNNPRATRALHYAWNMFCCYNGYVAIWIGEDELSVNESWSSSKECFRKAKDGEDKRES